jgi:hypothetical protein
MPVTEQAPVIEREVIREDELDEELDLQSSDGEIPPIFGKCPVCGKPLFPRDRYTNEPKAPPIGQGPLSRAKCDRCGAIIEYVGNGEWVPVEFVEEQP